MKRVSTCDDLFRAGRDMKIKEKFERKELNMTEIGNQTNEREFTTDEAGRLEELETVITENFQGFYAVGCALAEINASRLYRQKHVTFEDYCRERFEVSRQSAYQYIDARKVMDNLSAIGGQIKLLPLNERQVRPLTRLEPDAQAEAWGKVVASAPASGGITAKHVSEVVDGLVGKEIKKKAEKIKEKVAPNVSKEFTDALWALVEVVRAEVTKPLKVKMRENMRDSIRRVENLLAD